MCLVGRQKLTVGCMDIAQGAPSRSPALPHLMLRALAVATSTPALLHASTESARQLPLPSTRPLPARWGSSESNPRRERLRRTGSRWVPLKKKLKLYAMSWHSWLLGGGCRQTGGQAGKQRNGRTLQGGGRA
jgi:hypothetical protein